MLAGTMRILVTASAVALILVKPGLSQEPLTKFQLKEITQIGFVVENAAETALDMGRLFGGTWRFGEVYPRDLTFHDKYLGDVRVGDGRTAMGEVGNMQFEFIEPLSNGTHQEYLLRRGQCIHHIRFGQVTDYVSLMEGMKKVGIGIEMQGQFPGAPGRYFSYMDTWKDIGTIAEVTGSRPTSAPAQPSAQGSQGSQGSLAGTYTPGSPPAVSMEGKKLAKLGIVVGDVEKTAKRYWELFGVGPWTFTEVTAKDVVLHGRPLGASSFSYKSGLAAIGDLQIELIQPLSGPSTYVESLARYGSGAHYVGIGSIEDPDAVLAATQKAGYQVVMQGIVGEATQFFLVSSRKKPGIVFEFEKQLPGKTSSLKPYGTYPDTK